MNLRVRIIGLVGAFVLVVVLLGAWGIWSILGMQNRILVQHQAISEAELRIEMAKAGFARQARIWNEILLREGGSEASAELWSQFIAEESEVRAQIEVLLGMLPEDSDPAGKLGMFLRGYHLLGEQYREAFKVFEAGGEGSWGRGEGLMRGRDEGVAAVMEDISRSLMVERTEMEGQLRAVTLRRAAATTLVILVVSLTAFVVLAMALNRWMQLPLLTVDRRKQGLEPARFAVPAETGEAGLALAPVCWRRVLVVDDEEAGREELSRRIGEMDCEVRTARSASGAMQMLEGSGPQEGAANVDLIVIDDGMPGVDGYGLARVLKSQAETCGIPLVLWHSNAPRLEEVAEGTFAAVVAKAAGWGGMGKVLRKLLKKRAAAGEAALVPLDLEREYRRGRGERFLLADDDPMNRKYMGMMLNKVGIDYVGVENGRDAMEALDKERFGVVLMDCSMPVLDGYEATAQIRRREDGRERAVIIGVTAHDDSDSLERCRKAGMDGCVIKPVKQGQLWLLTEELLAGRA